MQLRLKPLAFICFSLLLSACGGGGSGGDSVSQPISSPPEPTFDEIIDSPTNFTVAELESAFDEKVMADYTGESLAPKLSPDNSQQAFQAIFGSDNVSFYDINPLAIEGLEDVSNHGQTLQCESGGLVTITEAVISVEYTTLMIEYEQCSLYDWKDIELTGTAAVNIFQLEENESSFTSYYNELQVIQGDVAYEVSGYASYAYSYEDSDSYETNVEISNNLIISNISNGTQLLDQTIFTYTGNDSKREYSRAGTIYITDIGKIEFDRRWGQDFTSDNDWHDVTTLIGQNSAKLEVVNESYMQYAQDDNQDGIYDVGAYLGNYYNWVYANLSELELVSFELLSLPPEIYQNPYFTSSYTTLDEIVVEPGYFEDPDTPADQLSVSFNWSINGELVEEYTDSSLPSRLAVFGDEVTVYFTVSDGVNSVQSSAASTTIQDSPAALIAQGAPENIHQGELVQFTVVIEDPDISDENIQVPVLHSSPPNASIDENGLVTWNSEEMTYLLPEQTFVFTFTSEDEESLELSLDITVETDMSLPIARSGIEVPTANYSMWVGDYDNDGMNEVLSTDNNQRLFMLEEDAGSYKQTWMYPFSMPTDGEIRQIVGINLDSDQQEEILVATEKGISLLDGLDGLASVLIEEEGYINNIAAADSNLDGNLIIAYLVSESEYSSSNIALKVIDLTSGEITTINSAIGEAEEMVFANVDEDAQLELITNNGLVYDGQDWSNEWFSGTMFGDYLVAAGDFNGDGIAEIAGADRWGYIKFFSAIDKSQLASFDNFNTCSLNSADIDGNGTDELLVGDCQWGSISGYELSNSSLETLWSIDMQEHGSKSVVAGDSDNDGLPELHWGSGQSSSGEDVFLVADYVDGEMTLNENSRSTQLDSFSTAGWSNDYDESKGIFFVPSTGSGYDDSTIATLSDTGEIALTSTISSNWDNSYHADIADFNKDGLADVFVPTTSLYDGALGVYQFSDMSLHWSVSGDYADNIGVIRAFDINEDGFEDAVYANSRTLQAIDVQNQVIIGNYTFDSNVYDLAATQVDGSIHLAVATYSTGLYLLKLNENSFSEISYQEQACKRLDFANLDQDALDELICLSSSEDELISYDVTAGGYQEHARKSMDFDVREFAVNSADNINQSIYILSSTKNGYCYSGCTYSLAELDSNFNPIWQGLPIIGTPTHRGMRFQHDEGKGDQLLFSTQDAMYWINP